jgi:pimeloyl-ACP methyl ester carboxylesterase
MTRFLSSSVKHHDCMIEAPGGHLFVRTWLHTDAANIKQIPIVLLHDSLGCVELWRSFPAALCAATQRRVIAYDRLGFGRSDARHDTLPFSFIDDEPSQGFTALRKALGVERFIVMGHSVGGCMAVQCAGAYAQYCDGLVTISAQAFNEARTRSGIGEASAAFQAREQFAKLEKYHGDKSSVPGLKPGWILHLKVGH